MCRNLFGNSVERLAQSYQHARPVPCPELDVKDLPKTAEASAREMDGLSALRRLDI
jgi:hypothetical protein